MLKFKKKLETLTISQLKEDVGNRIDKVADTVSSIAGVVAVICFTIVIGMVIGAYNITMLHKVDKSVKISIEAVEYLIDSYNEDLATIKKDSESNSNDIYYTQKKQIAMEKRIHTLEDKIVCMESKGGK